jgi:hypothetical protein
VSEPIYTVTDTVTWEVTVLETVAVPMSVLQGSTEDFMAFLRDAFGDTEVHGE